MSRDRQREDRRWSEEDLIEWVLDEGLREEFPREELERDSEVAARLVELESFLSSCRQELGARAEAELDPASRSALVDRILSSTTREDFSWRGDLRLVRGFLQQRLRSSRLLRLVAASLLLHVIALPVLAYFTLFQPVEQKTRIGFETPPRELPYAPDVLEPEREVRELLLEEALDAYPLFLERLGREGRGGLDVFSTGAEERVWGDSLGLVLWCEVLMDDLEAPEPAPGRKRRLEFALGELGELLIRSGDQMALNRLAASAWLRACEAGWIPEDPDLRAICRERLEGGVELSASEWARDYHLADGE